jgi:hypothetical protein
MILAPSHPQRFLPSRFRCHHSAASPCLHPLQIYDLDVEFIARNGYQLNIDLDDGMHDDRFDFNTTIGGITSNDDW